MYFGVRGVVICSRNWSPCSVYSTLFTCMHVCCVGCGFSQRAVIANNVQSFEVCSCRCEFSSSVARLRGFRLDCACVFVFSGAMESVNVFYCKSLPRFLAVRSFCLFVVFSTVAFRIRRSPAVCSQIVM